METTSSLSLRYKLTALAGVAIILPSTALAGDEGSILPTEPAGSGAPPQTPGFQQHLSELARNEMVRRQKAVLDADVLFQEGREAYLAEDYQKAVDKFSSALQKVPDAPLFADRRESYQEHLTKARTALAMVYREKGDLEESEILLESILAANPDDEDAARALRHLRDPIRTNQALTPEYVEDVNKVNELLMLADSEYQLGKFKNAKRYYEEILLIDEYNTQARRGIETVTQAMSDYYRSAYDQARAELLMMVDSAWELSIPREVSPENLIVPIEDDPQSGVAYITEKLRSITIPSIDFQDTTVQDAIEFLRMRAAELDTMELEPNRKGVNFVIRAPRGDSAAGLDDELGDALGGNSGIGGDIGSLRIDSLTLKEIPLEVALKYICEETKLRYKIENYAVVLVPQTETGEDLYNRTFTVPPDFRSKIASGATGGVDPGDPFAPTGGGADSAIGDLPTVRESLQRSGVSFTTKGASATLTGNSLVVTNTPTEIDKIELLVQAIVSDQPRQIKITTKFVEITQNNSDELGFDWVIGPFFSGDGNLAGAGGTIGNGAARTGLDFSGPVIPGISAGSTDVTNITTAGLRSGDFGVAGNSIDAIINNPTRAIQNQHPAPGILSLTGLFSDGQLKVIMRGLQQKKGVDLMTAPSITARPGEKASIEIIREFIYPTEYDPPQLQGGGGGGGGFVIPPAPGGPGTVQAFPVVPANPTAFETRNTGVTLEIEATLGDNDFLINLRFVPEIVEFEGFINYGSPIQTAGTNGLGQPVTVTITENRIEMPVFNTRRVNTALSIYDGYTVAIGGLMREDVQNIEDSVPVLGDIPLFGRLFQTKAENRIKKNLIIFVKAQIIDPTGRPIRGSDDDSDSVNVGIDDGGTSMRRTN